MIADGKPGDQRARRRWSRAIAVAAALCAFAATAAEAGAQQRVIAGPAPSTYLTTTVTIDQGEALSFWNLDLTAVHDVASFDRAADNSFLFKSEVISAPEEVPVSGAELLPGGSYDFFCTIHPFMRGTLTVRGGGGGGGGDTTAPSLRLKVLDKRIARVLRAGELRTRVTVDEAATVRLRATAGRAGKAIAAGRQRFGARGSKVVAAKLTKAGKRMLKRSKRVRVTVAGRAVDGAGNERERSAAGRLR